MAKLLDQPIEEKDIIEYLTARSDFAFEVKTLSVLCKLGFTCDHAGTYEDPSTGKARQFDIRATRDKQLSDKLFFRLLLSVECKNLRPNFPLLIHCMSRQKVECTQSWIWSFPPVAYGFYCLFPIVNFDKFDIVYQDKSQFHTPFVEFRSPNLLQGFGLPLKVRVEDIRICKKGKTKEIFYLRSAVDNRSYVLYMIFTMTQEEAAAFRYLMNRGSNLAGRK